MDARRETREYAEGMLRAKKEAERWTPANLRLAADRIEAWAEIVTVSPFMRGYAAGLRLHADDVEDPLSLHLVQP